MKIPRAPSQNALVGALLLLVVLCLTASCLLQPGVPAFRHDWNIPFFRSALLHMYQGTDGFTDWNAQNLGSRPFYPSLAGFLAVVSGFASLGLSASIIVKLLIAASMWGAATGTYALARGLGRSPFAATVGAIAVGASPFMFTTFCKGLLQEAVGLAALPWAIETFRRACDRKDPRKARAAAILCGIILLLTSFQIQILAFGALLVTILAVARKRPSLLLITGGTTFLICLWFIAPLFISTRTINATLTATTSLQVIREWSPSLPDVLRMTGFRSGFLEQALDIRHALGPWRIAALMLGIVTSCSALLALREAKTRPFALAYLASVLLATGTAGLGGLYEILLARVPMFFMFRESFYFIGLVALCGGLVLAFLLDGVRAFPGGKALGPALALLILATDTAPFLAGGLTTQLQSVQAPAGAAETDAALRGIHDDRRMLSYPFYLPIRPTSARFWGVDPSISWSPRETFGNYTNARIAKTFSAALAAHDTPVAEALLNWANVGFLDDRSWLRDEFLTAAQADFSPMRENLDDAAMRASFNALSGKKRPDLSSDVEHVRERNGVSQARSVDARAGAIVSDDWEAAPLLQRAYPATFYAPQQLDDPRKARTLAESVRRFIFVNGETLDVLQMLLPRGSYAEPGAYAPWLDARLGWAPIGDWNSWWWFRYPYNRTTHNPAISGPDAHEILSIPFPDVARTQAHLFVKMLHGPSMGNVRVQAGDRTCAIAARANAYALRWTDCGAVSVSAATSVRLSPEGHGGAVAAAVILAPEAALEDAHRELLRCERGGDVVWAITRVRESVPIMIGRGSTKTLVVEAKNAFSKEPVVVTIGPRTLSLAGREGQRRAVFTVADLPAGKSTLRIDGPGSPAVLGAFLADQAPLSVISSEPLQRLSGTSRQGTISRPSIVVLPTAFDPAWLLPGAAAHGTVDGYANGWLVEHPGKISVFFSLSKAADAARVISSLSLIALSIVCFLLGRSKNENEAATD